MAELTRRYIVMAMSLEGPLDRADRDAAFVLKPWKDPAALRALESYRDHCYPELARELDEWIRIIDAGEAELGGVGARNAPYASKAPARALRSAAATRPPRPRAKPKPKTSKMRTKKRK